MKTLDIIRWLMVSLTALVAVIFAAGWVNWYYPADPPLVDPEYPSMIYIGEAGQFADAQVATKADLEFIGSIDFSAPVDDAQKAMGGGDLRLWPIFVGHYPDDIASIPLHVPVGIWCEDPWKPYVYDQFFTRRWTEVMFVDLDLQLVQLINKYSGVVISRNAVGTHFQADLSRGSRRSVELRPTLHPAIENFRDAYIKYATAYNQRILADHSRQISEVWGYNLRCSPVTGSAEKNIIEASLFGERGRMRRSLLTDVN